MPTSTREAKADNVPNSSSPVRSKRISSKSSVRGQSRTTSHTHANMVGNNFENGFATASQTKSSPLPRIKGNFDKTRLGPLPIQLLSDAPLPLRLSMAPAQPKAQSAYVMHKSDPSDPLRPKSKQSRVVTRSHRVGKENIDPRLYPSAAAGIYEDLLPQWHAPNYRAVGSGVRTVPSLGSSSGMRRSTVGGRRRQLPSIVKDSHNCFDV